MKNPICRELPYIQPENTHTSIGLGEQFQHDFVTINRLRIGSTTCVSGRS